MKNLITKITAFLCVLAMVTCMTPASFAQTASEVKDTDISMDIMGEDTGLPKIDEEQDTETANTQDTKPSETKGDDKTQDVENTEGQVSEVSAAQGTETDKTQNTETDKTQNTETDKTQNTETDKTQNTETDKTQNTETDKTQNTETDKTQNTETAEVREKEPGETQDGEPDEIQETESGEKTRARKKSKSLELQSKADLAATANDKEIIFSLEKTTYTYTGKEIKPAVRNVKVMVDGSPVSLTAADYSVLYDNNKDVCTDAKVILYGKGDYSGFFGSADFTIAAADIAAGCEISLNKTAMAYTGSALTPQVKASFNGITLKNKTDYTVAYYNNINVGTATVTVKGKGSFQGEVTMKFTIRKGAQKLKVSAKPAKIKLRKTTRIKVKGNKGKLTYKSSKPSVASVNGKGVVKGRKSGTTTITVTAAATDSYKKAAAKIKIMVKGEELTSKNTKVQLSRNLYTYDGKSKKPAVRKVTFKGRTLKKNKDYKIAYANNKNAGTATVTITGINKYSGTVETAYKIKKADNSLKAAITKTSIDIKGNAYLVVDRAHGDVTYASSNTKVAAVTKKGVITGRKRGSCTISVTASGDKNHKKATKKFSVTVGVMDLSDSDCSIALSSTSYVYDGTFKKPGVTVRYNGKQLTADKDYTVVYYDNINAGEAKVYIKGRGNYQGSRTVTFTISKAEQKSFSIYLKDNHIPYGGTAKVTVSGARGNLSYDSYSPSYAKPIGNGLFQGLKKTQNYVTITVTAAGDDNYRSKKIEMRVQIY